VVDQDTWRYELSESMRVFLIELEADDFERTRKKQAEYASSQATEFFELTFNGDLATAQSLYDQEATNFRVAFDWGIKNDPRISLHIAACLCMMWLGPSPGESRHYLERSLAAAPNEDSGDLAWTRANLASLDLNYQLLQESRDLLQLVTEQESFKHDPRLEVIVAKTYGMNHELSGNFDQAEIHIQQSLDIALKHDLKFLQSNAFSFLGELARSMGDTAKAERCYKEALDVAPNDDLFRSIIHFNLASNAIQEGHVDQAEVQFREALRLRKNAGVVFPIGIAGLGWTCVLKGEFERAGLFMGHVYARKVRHGVEFDPADAMLFSKMQALGQENGGTIFTEAFQRGMQSTPDQIDKLINDDVA